MCVCVCVERERVRERLRDWGTGRGEERREGQSITDLGRIVPRFIYEGSKMEKLAIKTCQVVTKKLSPYSTFKPILSARF